MIPLQYREYVKAINDIISQYDILLNVRQFFYPESNLTIPF